MRVDLGAGIYPAEGWLTVDAYTPADVQARVEALPFADKSCDELRLCHVLEHVSIGSVPTVLEECRRVLRRGRTLTVEVPDLDALAEKWLTAPTATKDRLVPFFYGGQQTEGEYHKNGFDAALFKHTLEEAGFVVEEIRPVFSHACDSLEATCVSS